MDSYTIKIRPSLYPIDSIKGSVVSTFLADLLIEDQEEETIDFSYEGVLQVQEGMCTMYFGRALSKEGFGASILLISPEGTYTAKNNASSCICVTAVS